MNTSYYTKKKVMLMLLTCFLVMLSAISVVGFFWKNVSNDLEVEQKKNERITKQFVEERTQKEAAQKEIRYLQQQLWEARDSINMLTLKIEEFETQIVQMESQLKDMNHRLKGSLTVINNLDEKYKNKKIELVNYKEQKRVFKKDIEQYKEQIITLETEKVALENQLVVAERDKKRYVQQIEQYEMEKKIISLEQLANSMSFNTFSLRFLTKGYKLLNKFSNKKWKRTSISLEVWSDSFSKQLENQNVAIELYDETNDKPLARGESNPKFQAPGQTLQITELNTRKENGRFHANFTFPTDDPKTGKTYSLRLYLIDEEKGNMRHQIGSAVIIVQNGILIDFQSNQLLNEIF